MFLQFLGKKEPGPIEGLRRDTAPTLRGPLMITVITVMTVMIVSYILKLN